MDESRTKITIEINFSLNAIKRAYRNYFGYKQKITKKELASWIGNLAEADLESLMDKES